MKKVIIAVIAGALLITGSIFVIAQKAGRGGEHEFGFGPGQHPGIGMALRGLDLTDDQKAKVKDIIAASKTNVEPLVQQLKPVISNAAR